MNILVIGGTGILSTAVVSRCIDRGDAVTMVNRGNRPDQINPKASFLKCDVRDIAQLDEISNKIRNKFFDVVIDFLVFSEQELMNSLKYFSGNAKQYVFISSAQVYNTSLKGVLTEDSPKPQNLWSYSVNKLKCENYLIDYSKKNHINYTIIRPAVNYDGTRIPYGIFPPMGFHWTLVERIKHDKPIITWNYGENRLNLTRVEDFAEATVGLLGNPHAYNEDFNVAGDNIYSWQEVLDVLAELLDKEVKTFNLPVDYYASELPDFQKEELLGGRANDMICSIDKLRRVLPNFTPKYNLKKGVAMTLDYYKSHNYLFGIDYAFDGDCDRIIKKYCKKINQSIPSKCIFIDYMKTGARVDKINYWKSLHKDSYVVRVIKRIKWIIVRLLGYKK